MKVEDLNIEGACWSWIKIDILNKSQNVEMLHILYNVTSKQKNINPTTQKLKKNYHKDLYLDFHSALLNIEPYRNFKFYVNDVTKFIPEINVTIQYADGI